MIAQGDGVSIDSRTRSVRYENSTQSVESQSSRSSPKTRSPWDCTRYQHQPTSSSVQRGPLSSDSLSRSAVNRRQPNPDQSNSWLPIRLASPMKFYQVSSSHEIPKFFHGAASYCQSVRLDKRGGCRRRKAEFGDVSQLTVLYGCSVSNDGSNRLVTPYSSQGTMVTLWRPGVKPAAPMKTETTSEFVGWQINDIVNCFVSPSASGTPHESQFDGQTTRSVKSNTFPYGVFKVELELNHLPESRICAA